MNAGLSRRRLRVRVPSLPSLKVPANRHFCVVCVDAPRCLMSQSRGPNVQCKRPANGHFGRSFCVRSHEQTESPAALPAGLLSRQAASAREQQRNDVVKVGAPRPPRSLRGSRRPRAGGCSPGTRGGPSCAGTTSRKARARACLCGAGTRATPSSRAISHAAWTSPRSWSRP
jgi:hypothetical protein